MSGCTRAPASQPSPRRPGASARSHPLVQVPQPGVRPREGARVIAGCVCDLGDAGHRGAYDLGEAALVTAGAGRPVRGATSEGSPRARRGGSPRSEGKGLAFPGSRFSEPSEYKSPRGTEGEPTKGSFLRWNFQRFRHPPLHTPYHRPNPSPAPHTPSPTPAEPPAPVCSAWAAVTAGDSPGCAEEPGRGALSREELLWPPEPSGPSSPVRSLQAAQS